MRVLMVTEKGRAFFFLFFFHEESRLDSGFEVWKRVTNVEWPLLLLLWWWLMVVLLLLVRW